VSSWRKIAEPRPATVGSTLYSTTANCRYATVARHSASPLPRNGGLVPHATWRNVL